jgi:hypothetical protein
VTAARVGTAGERLLPPPADLPGAAEAGAAAPDVARARAPGAVAAAAATASPSSPSSCILEAAAAAAPSPAAAEEAEEGVEAGVVEPPPTSRATPLSSSSFSNPRRTARRDPTKRFHASALATQAAGW